MDEGTNKLFQEIFKKLDNLDKMNTVKGGNVSTINPVKIPPSLSPSLPLGKNQVAGQSFKRFYNIALRGSLYLGAVAVIFFIIYSSGKTFNFISETNKNIQNHWFTKFIKNPVEHVVTIFRNLFNVFMSPFVTFFENIMHVLTDLVKNLQNIRLMINYLRESIKTFLLDIATMFYGYAEKLSYLFERLKASFMLIGRVFDDIYTGLLYIMSLLNDTKNTLDPFFPVVEGVVDLVDGIGSFFSFL